MQRVEVSAVLDEGRWTGYQKLLVAGTALAIILDGVDNQLLPNALPRLMEEWNRPRTDFNTALAAAPFGMMLGGILGGVLGDRFGRRTTLLGSVITFGLITLAIAWVETIESLTLLRFLAGIGLGGAMPTAAALASEYVPRRQRPFAVTLTIVCIPLGGVVASAMAGAIIPRFGWEPLFVAGGVVPLVLGAFLFVVLPESPRYLARHPRRWPELTRMLRRMGHHIQDDVSYNRDDVTETQPRVSLWKIFAPAYLRDTLALCVAFFFCLMANYFAILLIPTVFRSAGFEQAGANLVLQLFNWGGVAGAVIGGLVIQQVGSRIAMVSMSVMAIATSLALAGMTLETPASLLLMTFMIVTGALLNGVQTTMYALAAHVYPTEIRGTGVGAAVAFGRIGNIAAAPIANEGLTRGGNPAYFGLWAIAMAIVTVALAAMKRHVPRSRDLQAVTSRPVPPNPART